MFDTLVTLANRIRPEIASLSEQRRLVGAGVVISILYTLPLGLVGLIWLVIETDLSVLFKDWLLVLGFFIQIIIFNQVSYFFIVHDSVDRSFYPWPICALALYYLVDYPIHSKLAWQFFNNVTLEFTLNYHTVACAINTTAFGRYNNLSKSKGVSFHYLNSHSRMCSLVL